MSCQDHEEVLEIVFIRLRKYGLKWNISKSTFGSSRVTYLGYVINEHGIKPGQEKLKVVSDFPAPNYVKNIVEFVDLSTFSF